MTKMLHIGIIGPCNPSEFQVFLGIDNLPNINAAASSVNTFAKECLLQGYKISIFSLYEGCKNVLEYHSDSLNIYLIPRRFRIRKLSFFSPLYAGQRLYNVIKTHKDSIDIFHAQWTYEYAWAAQKFEPEKPVFCTVRDWCPFILSCQKGISAKIFWLMKYLIFKRVMRRTSTHFIANSIYTYNCIISAYPDKQINIVSNPIQKEYFLNGNKLDSRYTFISICQDLNEGRKNILTLLRAFAKYKEKNTDSSLCLIGRYQKNNEIIKSAVKEGLLKGVFLAGAQKHHEVFEYLDQSYCLVHPSKEETFGNILLEAAARKTLCIGGQNSGAVPQVLGNGEFGLLCDVNDVNDLYHSMLESQDKEKYNTLVKKAYNYVKENYSSDVIVKNTIKIYSQYLPQ